MHINDPFANIGTQFGKKKKNMDWDLTPNFCLFIMKIYIGGTIGKYNFDQFNYSLFFRSRCCPSCV